MKITEGVYAVSDARETVNAAFVATERGTVVIDTMRQPSDGQLLRGHVDANTAKPVYLVVNTHYHADHTFGNGAFSAPVLATNTTRRLMGERLHKAWESLTGTDGAELPLPEVTFDGTLYLNPAGLTMELREVGGHAPGTTVVYIPEKSVLMTSDLIFAGRFPYMGDADLAVWTKMLRELESLEPRFVIPGHGDPAGPELLVRQRQWMEQFYQRARELLREGSPDRALEAIVSEYSVPDYRREMLKKVLENIE